MKSNLSTTVYMESNTYPVIAIKAVIDAAIDLLPVMAPIENEIDPVHNPKLNKAIGFQEFNRQADCH